MDKRKIFVPALFLLAVSGASAWEETNPNAARMNGKEVKVEKALQGVYLSTELLQCFSNSVSLDMGYFREDCLASTFTLRTLAGLSHTVYWVHGGVDQFGQEYINYKENPKKPYYGLNHVLETAPRWYFSHRPRYKNGQRTMLNSGWFVGVPIQVASSLLSQPIFSSDEWLPEHVALGVTCGCRQASVMLSRLTSCWKAVHLTRLFMLFCLSIQAPNGVMADMPCCTSGTTAAMRLSI